MSGIKPPELAEFYRRLHGRRMDTVALAGLVGVSRPALTRVLNGARRRGPIWPKIARHLTAGEIDLLDVAHSSTWNTRRVAKRPHWSIEKAELLSV